MAIDRTREPPGCGSSSGPALSGVAEEFRVNLELLPEAAMIYAIDGTILSVNSITARIFETDTSEIIGKNLFSMGAIKAEEAREAVARLMRGEAIRFEIDFVSRKGHQRRLEVLHIPMLTPAGEVNRVLGFARDITENWRIEREQALLAAIVESSDDAIISLSADLTILSWNRGAEKLLGFSAAEAIGQPVTLYIPPDLRAYGLNRLREMMQHLDRVQSLEVPCLRKDGACVDVWTVCVGIRDSHGKLLGISAIHRDLTERKRAEREQALLAALVKSSDDAIISLSTDFRITSWNQGAQRLLGYTADEAIGQSPLDLYVPPEDRAKARGIMAADIGALSGDPESVRAIEVTILKKDRTPIEVSLVACGIRDAVGKLLGMSTIVRDVTERKRAEREATALAAVVNASRDAIIAFSRELKITSWNPAAEHVYGYSASEAIGRGFDLFVPPAELPRALEADRRMLESGEPVSFEQRAQRGDGTWFTSLINIFPIRDPSGTIIGGAGIGRDITHLKEVEQELREARDYTRALIESSVDAMVMVDRNLRISDGNEQLAKLTEVPKRILVGSRFDSYFTEPQQAAAAIEAALAEGSVTDIDLVLRAASGRQILVSFNASVFSRAGVVSGIFGVARDVTEQRAIQRKLDEERQYSNGLVEFSPDALLVTNANLSLMDINEQSARLTGYRREDLVGVALGSIFTQPEKVADVARRALETGLVREAEACLLTRTTEEIPVSLNASVFRNGDGSMRGVIMGVRDISEHKRAEKERSLLASVIGASGDAIYSESTDLTVTSWNPAAERLFGYSAQEMIGRNVAMMVPLARRAEMLEQFSTAANTGKTERFETTRQRKDGRGVEVLIIRSPILDSANKVVGFSVIAHDISASKRIEAELTAARDAALEAARAKSAFLANMSHEIRTPLNSVIGMTGLLLDTRLTPEQREYAHDVRESGEALLTLINEILDFSKLAAGKVVLEEIDFELTAAVESAVELVAEQARRKGLELTISIDAEAPQAVRGDPGRLRQVLLNLVGNAIKFTARGEVAVQVSKLSESHKEVILRFEVRDTGVGIPEDKLHLLFQPFSQVDASTTRHFGGTGLGLSIARQLVECMGGAISVSSTAGVGSTFWFTAKFARALCTVNQPAERFASFGDVKALIVDDNANSLRILGSQLAAWKMEIATAGSADRALEMMRDALASHAFEVVLSDVQMPEVDGIELARRIKTDPALDAPAVILVSSVGTAKDFAERLQGFEVDAWLTKPVPQSALYNALLNALAPRKGVGPQTSAAASEGASAEPQHRAKLNAGRRLRVLLAEDNPINQKLARFQLKKLGVEVDCVANGREAVEAAMRIPYDAVLMDCQMPEMDGYEATKEIRRLEGGARHTWIIALTAHALAGDRETCLDAGMDAYVSKPVKPEILEGILAEVVAPNDAAAARAPESSCDGPLPSEATAAPAVSGAIPPA